MENQIRDHFKALIQDNIELYGYHLTIVSAGVTPRYAYTIGLTPSLGFELVFAGGIQLMKNELTLIIDEFVKALNENNRATQITSATLNYATLTLILTDDSWTSQMLHGVLDYYDLTTAIAMQIIPPKELQTLDIPDMGLKFDSATQPIWRWLIDKWTFPVPKESTVTTDIASMKGGTITEIMRWEKDYWEMFTGPVDDLNRENLRVVPLATMIGIDNSVLPSMTLEIGHGFFRKDYSSEWNPWK